MNINQFNSHNCIKTAKSAEDKLYMDPGRKNGSRIMMINREINDTLNRMYSDLNFNVESPIF